MYDNGAVGIFGYDYRKAPHGFLVEHGHVMVLWGKRPGGASETKIKLKRDKKATDETGPNIPIMDAHNRILATEARLRKAGIKKFGRAEAQPSRSTRVEGKFYMQQAVDQTKEGAEARFVAAIEANVQALIERMLS